MADAGRALLIGLNDVPVGVLRFADGLSSFELLDEYRELPRRPVLGQMFEEYPNGRWRQHQRLPEWFANLLPEDPLREVIANALEISPNSEFKLIEALAEDLPGALTAAPVDARELLFGNRCEIPRPEVLADEPPGVRFSVAGVQLKLSAVLSQGTLTLAGRGRYGDHLVKLPVGGFAGVPRNEYYMMQFAQRVGIDVAEVGLVPRESLGVLPASFQRLRDEPSLLVKRFDRVDSAGRRMHMEDLNQVVGNWPEDKYRGASYERVALIILALCGKADYLEFVRRLAFCVGIGNEDAHLKNWSLWYPDGVSPRLSPAYDLVSTIQYDDLQRGLALRLGGSREASRVDRVVFERLARKTGTDVIATVEVVDETVDAMAANWPLLVEELGVEPKFRERMGDHVRTVPLLKEKFT